MFRMGVLRFSAAQFSAARFGVTQFSVIFAVRTTRPHFSSSALMNAAKASGEALLDLCAGRINQSRELFYLSQSLLESM
jgi:hypothetical protein